MGKVTRYVVMVLVCWISFKVTANEVFYTQQKLSYTNGGEKFLFFGSDTLNLEESLEQRAKVYKPRIGNLLAEGTSGVLLGTITAVGITHLALEQCSSSESNICFTAIAGPLLFPLASSYGIFVTGKYFGGKGSFSKTRKSSYKGFYLSALAAYVSSSELGLQKDLGWAIVAGATVGFGVYGYNMPYIRKYRRNYSFMLDVFRATF